MHRAIALVTLLLLGVNSQNLFSEIFDMNMGIPDLRPSPCLEGRSTLEVSECSSSSESSETVVETKPDSPRTPEESPQGCGYRNPNGVGVFTTAMDESEAHFGEFPWVVAILKKERLRSSFMDVYKCSGSLIHPQVVLTVGHHVWTDASAEYKVRAGEWEPHRQSEEFPHQERLVSYRIIHPRFHNRDLHFDIALLFLEQPFDLSPSISTICLAPATQLPDSSPCYMSGWGIKATDGEPPSVLKKIALKIRPNRECQRDLRLIVGSHFVLHNSFMCAGGELHKDACLGDGGAPLMCPIANTTNRYYQAGIVSWGLGCGQSDVPGVYTNLRFLRAWIDQQMSVRKMSSSFFLPE